jgi:hypothetical protein
MIRVRLWVGTLGASDREKITGLLISLQCSGGLA